MIPVIIDEPYEFIPHHRGDLWPLLLRPVVRRFLRKSYGIIDTEWRDVEHLNASLAAGHGILLAPNHCRPSDPFLLGTLSRETRTNFYVIASWHIFKQSWLANFLVRRMGAFSIYREGMDRAAVTCAIDILEKAERPLVIFPEGIVTRTNDLLRPLMEGTAFIARTAARKRARANPGSVVVLHPLAFKYLFQGDLESALKSVLGEIEVRLAWQPQDHLPILDRIRKVGLALLSLKELEYLQEPQSGSVAARMSRLIDHLLIPLEEEWLEGNGEGSIVARVKKLRTAILPDMINGDIADEERERRWRQLADLYLAQQLSCYPAGYVGPDVPRERLLETVERFEEDLTDVVRVHGPIKAVARVGEAIEVSPRRERGGGVDPLMQKLEEKLNEMIAALTEELQTPLGDKRP